MADLQDIQIRINFQVSGQQALKAATDQIQRTTKSTSKLFGEQAKATKVNWGQVRSWQALGQMISESEQKYDQMYRASYRLQMAGRQLTDVGMGIVGFLGNAAEAYGDYEFMLNRAAGAMLTNRDLYDDLSKAIMDVAKEVRLFKPEEVAKATYFWASTTGQQVETLEDLEIALQGITPILKTAALTETNFESAIKGVYSIIRQYNMNLSDTTDVTEKLMLMTQRTALEFPDLIQSFQYVGPLAHSLGISFEEVAITLGVLGDLGLRGSKAGRGLGMFLTQMVRPAPKGIKAMNKLLEATMGVQDGYNKLVFPEGKFIGIENFVTLLANATKNLTDQQKLQYITTIVGTQNAARQIIPLIDAQIAAMEKGANIFKDPKYSLATAHEEFEKMFGYLAESWKGLTGALENTFMPIIYAIGKEITKIAAPVVNAITQIVDAFADWMEQNPEMVTLVTKLLAVSGALLVIIGSIITFIGVFVGIAAAFAQLNIHVRALSATFFVLGALVAFIADGIANDLGGIRTAMERFAQIVAAVFTDADEDVGGFTKVFQELKRLVDEFSVGVFERIADILNTFSTVLGDMLEDPEQGPMLKAIAGAFLSIATALLAMRGALFVVEGLIWLLRGLTIAMPIITGLGLALTGLKGGFGILTTIAVGIRAISAALTTNPIGLLLMAIVFGLLLLADAWNNNWNDIQGKTAEVWAWIEANVMPVVNQIITGIGEFLGEAVAWFGELWAWVQQNAGEIVAALLTPFQIIIDNWDKITEVVGKAIDGIVNAFELVKNTVIEVWTNIIQPAIDEAIGELLNDFGNLVDSIMNFLGPAWEFLISLLGYVGYVILWLVENASPVVAGFLDFLVRTFGTAFESILGIVVKILGWIMDTIGSVLDLITGIINAFISLTKGDWDGFWQGLADAAQAMADFIFDTIGTFLGILGDLIWGGLQLILNIWETIMGDGPGSIIASIGSFIGDMYQFAQDAVQGFLDGIGAMAEALNNTINGFVDTIADIIGDLPSNIYNIGKDIVKGFLNGLKSMKDWIIRQVTNFFKDILPGPIKDIFGISSPSKLMAQYGKFMIQGLAQGLSKSEEAERQMKIAAQNLSRRAKAGLDGVANTLSTDLTTGGNFSSTSDSTRIIKLQIDVSSTDGSVSKLDQSRIQDALNSSKLVAALEHMAAVN